MIVRIVKMTFKADKVEQFKGVFDASKEKIRAYPGVMHLELLQDKANPSIFFTYSQWESEKDLENYRNSELFKVTWAQTKPLFKEAAQAWTTYMLHHLN